MNLCQSAGPMLRISLLSLTNTQWLRAQQGKAAGKAAIVEWVVDDAMFRVQRPVLLLRDGMRLLEDLLGDARRRYVSCGGAAVGWRRHFEAVVRHFR